MDIDEEIACRVRDLTKELHESDDEATIEAVSEQRDRLLDRAGLSSRVRADDEGDVLVLYPDAWLDEAGTIDISCIDDPSDAVELPLDPRSEEADWADVNEHNRAIAETVAHRHGPVHGATAKALGTYLANHHLRRIEAATETELQTFREDYFVRNTWPEDEQEASLERSIELTVEVAEEQSVGEDRRLDRLR